MNYEKCHIALVENYNDLFIDDRGRANYNKILNYLIQKYNNNYDIIQHILLSENTLCRDIISSFNSGYVHGYLDCELDCEENRYE